MSRVRPAAAVIAALIALVVALGASTAILAADSALDPALDPAPVGAADAYDAPHAGDFSVDVTRGVLANDIGTGLVAELWTDAMHGTVTLAPDGGFGYVRTEIAAFDTFVYLASDAADGSTGPVKVTIRFANDPPVCASARGPDGQPGDLVEFDLAGACADADGDPLTFTYQQPDVPLGSAWEADAAGHLTFLPPPDWSGTGTVIFSADDGMGASMPVAFSVRVLPAAD